MFVLRSARVTFFVLSSQILKVHYELTFVLYIHTDIQTVYVDSIPLGYVNSRKEAQTASHNLIFYRVLFPATCFGCWHSHHQEIRNIQEERYFNICIYLYIYAVQQDTQSF